jgi:hypothetical protein
MITIRFSGRQATPIQYQIGMETDQDAETLRFDLPQIADDQTAQLLMLLPDGTPDALNIRDGMAVVPATMTEQPGRIRAWVEILGGGIAWNSELFYLDVGDLPPISEQIERQYPTAIQAALDAESRAQTYWENSTALNAETAKLKNMTAGAHDVAHDAGADAVLSEVSGHYHLEISVPQGPPGVPGRNAVVQNLAAVEIAFQIIDGHLILFYGDNIPPQFSINSEGHLIYEF